jgi:hypothetical protein
MKRFLLLGAVLLLSLPTIFAEKYRIADISYSITGITREYAMKQEVSISTTRIFYSYEELHKYVDDIKQQLENTRVFSSVIINLRYDSENSSSEDTVDSTLSQSNPEDYIELIHLSITTVDAYHFLAVPYYKFDSNSGHVAKIKMKDTNFLGTMKDMAFDINLSLEKEDEGRSETYKPLQFGVNFSFDYPFPLGPVNTSWNNDLSLSYTIGDFLPQFGYKTGFTFELPFDDFSLKLDLTQSITRNTDDYEKYGDSFYYTEEAELSLPVRIATVDNWGKVWWTPYVSYTSNWDKDGISEENDDLSGPVYSVGHSLSTSRINWYGNFRQGLSLSANQAFNYNSQRNNFAPEVSGELKGYKAFKYVGFCTDIYFFASLNGSKKIGSRLRGIRDNQYYGDIDEYALQTPTAIVFSLDMPVHVFSTDWLAFEDFLFGTDSKLGHAFNFMRHFDFEVQLSPFVDAALTKNKVTGTTLNYKDGFYDGGLEMLIFPAKWKGLVVRASFGIDAGRKIIAKYVPKLVNNDWRSQCSAYEFTFGIGLQY